MAEPLVPSVLKALEGSDISEFSDAEENFPLDERTVSLDTADITNISEPVATNSKPNVRNVDSLNLDLEQ